MFWNMINSTRIYSGQASEGTESKYEASLVD